MYNRSLHLERERALKQALGAKKAKLLNSGWVMVAETSKGIKRRIFINERNISDFGAGVYSFTDEWMSYCKDYDNPLIAVVCEENWKDIVLIDPNNYKDSFSLLVTKDERADKIFNFIKL